MKQSEKNQQVYTALMNARAEMDAPAKSGDNPHFKYTYATLEDVIAVIEKVLPKHNLVWVQDVFSQVVPESPQVHKTVLVGRLVHVTSGEFIEYGPLIIPVKDPDDPQKVKSGVTYMKRTQLQAAFGLADHDDDDGNDAARGKDQARPSGKREEKKDDQKDEKSKAQARPAPADAIEKFKAEIKACNNMDQIKAVGAKIKGMVISDDQKVELKKLYGDQQDSIKSSKTDEKPVDTTPAGGDKKE